MFKQFMMLLNKVDDVSGGGGGTPASETPPAAPATDAAGAAAIETPGDNLDDYGYAKVKDPAAPKEGEKPGEKKETPATPPKEESLADIKDPASGYGIEAPVIPKDDSAPAAVVPAAEPPKPPEEIEIDAKGLGDADALKIKDFAKANGLSKEQAQKLADMKKVEIADITKAQASQLKQHEITVAKTKATWHNELKTDKDFGGEAGEKFDKSLLKVEKVLKDFLPATKKALTEGGITLNPSVMKDLVKLADKLYGAEKFEQGNAGQEPEDGAGKEEHQPWDVYKIKEA